MDNTRQARVSKKEHVYFRTTKPNFQGVKRPIFNQNNDKF